MSVAEILEGIFAVLVIVVALTIVGVWWRRRRLSSTYPVVLCALRPAGAPRWRLGLARLQTERFEWFSIAGPSLRPEVSRSRRALEFGVPGVLDEPIPGLPDAIAVEARCDQEPGFGLAFAPNSYTAVRAWLESAPPSNTVYFA